MSKESLQLPKTAFSMKANLPTREPEFITEAICLPTWVFFDISFRKNSPVDS